MKIHDVNYSRDWYDRHRGRLNSERKSIGLKPHVSHYEIIDVDGPFGGGYNTAMLFSTSTVKEKVVPMLLSLKEQEILSAYSHRFYFYQIIELGQK